MTEKDFTRLLESVIDKTVARLKAADLIKNTEQARTAAEKTEELLRKYPLLKSVNDKRRTVQTVRNIEKALEKIKEDPYCDIIRCYYFEDQSAENIALDLNVSTKTVRKHKQRLVDILAALLFSDDVIWEIFQGDIILQTNHRQI